MSRTLLIGLGAALVVSNAFWLYDSIDQSVTVDHQATEIVRQQARAELLTRLVVDYPRETDASGAYAILKARYPDAIVKLRGDTVEFHELIFEHQNGKLQRITPF
jgi:hypothetical protein